MTVRATNNEVTLKFPAKMKVSKKQEILDYLKYESLTANSIATEKDADKLIATSKKGRWNKIKSTLKY